VRRRHATDRYPDRAAEYAKAALAASSDPTIYGRAAVIRLKSLYQDGRMNDVMREAARFQSDQRCQSYLSQILYLAWTSSRRENMKEEADRAQEAFLKRYPEHPFGADMYFASALGAMAEGEYSKALCLLKNVEAGYGRSRDMYLVKRVKEQIEQIMQHNTADTP
jgi:hypothetical protein